MSEWATVRAQVDTCEGTRMVADIPVLREVQLGCGCTRYEGIRPGADPDRSPVGRVHILSGCGFHVDERWRRSIPDDAGPQPVRIDPEDDTEADRLREIAIDCAEEAAWKRRTDI